MSFYPSKSMNLRPNCDRAPLRKAAETPAILRVGRVLAVILGLVSQTAGAQKFEFLYDAAGNMTTCRRVEVPAAPSGLTAAGTSAARIDLAWVADSTFATATFVERKTGASGTYVQIASLGPFDRTYADIGLPPFTGFFYRVRASGPGGLSSYSNEAYADTNTGSMILSDTNSGLAVNAYGGAHHGGELRLVSNCTNKLTDCTWTYRDGMILSDTNPGLAVNAYGGARHLGELRLVNNCSSSNPDCTWTYRRGMFVSDSNPAVAINAYGGAVSGTVLKLVNDCNSGLTDCTWTQTGAMIQNRNDPHFSLIASAGATSRSIVTTVSDCGPGNPDCSWVIHKGMILSSADNGFAMNAYGGALYEADLEMVNNCSETLPDCTFTFQKGFLYSDNASWLIAAPAGGVLSNGGRALLNYVSDCDLIPSICAWTWGSGR